MISNSLMSSFASNNPEFGRLQRLQDRMGNITTYVNGELRIVAYPANIEGEPVSPLHVWIMLITHDLPRLFCFHGREAWVRIPESFTPGMALCRSEDDSCGYMVDFFQIARHPNVRTKVYNYRESAVRVAVETTPDRLGPEDDRVIDFALHTTTEHSPGPGTVATRPTTARDIPDTPPPSYNTVSTAPDAVRPINNAPPQDREESDQTIQELFAALQTPRGVEKGRFWRIFRRCSFCPFIVKKNSQHRCMPVIDLTINDEEMPDIIDLTGDDEMRDIIDLTGDDNEVD